MKYPAFVFLVLIVCSPLSAEVPVVTSAVANPVTNTLVIGGSSLPTSPQVTLNAIELAIQSATPVEIVADLPPGLAPGNYLLLVTRPPSAVSAAFVLTVGAVGPPGPQGDPGPSGILELAGRMCPAGTFLIGFDSAAQLICGSLVVPGVAPVVTAITTFPPQAVTTQRVNLSIAASDADGDPLSFETQFVSVPPQSHAQLQQVFGPSPGFVPDLPGLYVTRSIAIDPAGHRSLPSELDVFVMPCGSASPDVTLFVTPPFGFLGVRFQVAVLINESANSACTVLTHSFQAQFASVPPNAPVPVIFGASTGGPEFTPEAVGFYTLGVTVTSSLGISTTRYVTVEVQ